MPIFKAPNIGSFYIPKPHMPRVKATYRVRFTNRGHRVVDYTQRWKRTFLFQAGASLRTWAIRSFKRVVLPLSKRSGKPLDQRGYHSNAPAKPFAHKKKKDFLSRAIQFGVSIVKEDVLIGTAFSRAKLWGYKHEWGAMHGKGKGGKKKYPKRAFMRPTLDKWLSSRFGFRKVLSRSKDRAFKNP